ncbi:MAG TPA: c-type cytochrome [Ramlibacter sp.]|uniref:c-type cytochrome n=1 Tax=Ramlibacter sp. TaxID=1917967 RepID=UPI002D80D645|nr:c-type cytochrome [Ramlibacter sp.]HET8744583.1 c-type cytochrome [Ramlibacter sp.]
MKSPVSLLLAAVLAAFALHSGAQQPASEAASAAPAASAAAPGASGLTVAPPAASGSEPAPGPAAATPAPAAPAAVATAATGKPDPAAGEAKFGTVCAACHGQGGNSGTPANPKLAAQHAAYVFKQLQEFKSGKRPNPIMQGFASQLTEADMKNIAAYVGAQKSSPGFAKDKELVSLGERIYRGGDQSRQMPACAGCHSPNGAGIPAQYPRLSGQYAEYTASQLVAFRDGIRKNSPQMAQIAAKLNDREIRAVADYIAGLR